MRRKLLANDAKMQLEHHQLVATQRLHDFNQLQREWVVKQNEQFLLILQAARPTCYAHTCTCAAPTDRAHGDGAPQ